MNEIQQGLAAGKEVMVHTDPISVPGWTGEGYIITDAETGAGAYKITGGSNGGYLDSKEKGAFDIASGIYNILFGLFEIAVERGDPAIAQSVKSSTFNQILKGIAHKLVAVSLFLDVLELWSKCGAATAAFLGVFLSLVTFLALLVIMSTGPLGGFFVGLALDMGTAALKRAILNGGSCNNPA